ncbi:hypothetical protein [Nocardiopsis composta]|uniref:Uncharacterized protein n=1 Tax=Nocardiopsis composta TaxID=157465 RepID=A0A7W8VCW8_9ACTN|nr:hypothetical protein [Nocardiopsis composta]MBB5431319.1 hypothetical protein [Nocardiopsis composta]
MSEHATHHVVCTKQWATPRGFMVQTMGSTIRVEPGETDEAVFQRVLTDFHRMHPESVYGGVLFYRLAPAVVP